MLLRMRANIVVKAQQPTAALILRSLDPKGARRLEGWPNRIDDVFLIDDVATYR
jgi:hypothetical protein